jgi:hypothetical protein
MPDLESKRHAPIVNAVHDYITKVKAGQWLSVESLCLAFFGEYKPSLDTQMREIVREVRQSPVFHKIIISGTRGFKVCESKDEYEHYRATEIKRLVAAKENIDAIEYKAQHDDFMRLPLGKHDKPIYEAMLKDTPSGQRGFEL